MKKYFVLAFRIYQKNKLTSIINTLGFALGIAAFLLIVNNIFFEYSYDRFHENSKDIYRVTYSYSQNQLEETTAMTNAVVGKMMMESFPEVTDFTRLYPTRSVMSFENKVFSEDKIFLADASFFDVFSFPVLNSSTNLLLDEPGAVVITESMAKKYFGAIDPIGKTLYLDQKIPLKVQAVVKDSPVNSHIQFNFLVSFDTWTAYKGFDVTDNWGFITFYTYLLTQPGTSFEDLQSKIPEFVKNHAKENENFGLQPLTSIHLNSNILDEIEVNGDKDQITIYLLVALGILVVAWLNYVNMTTAQSINREKEVGIKKLLNASKSHLIFSFLTEVFVKVLIAVVFSVVLLIFLSPWVEPLTGLYIEPELFFDFRYLLIILSLIFATTFFAGIYPAFVLSSFKALSASQERVSRTKGSSILRNMLVIFQFTITGTVLIFTLSVVSQVEYLENHSAGIDFENIVVVKLPKNQNSENLARTQALKNQYMSTVGISNVCMSNFIPGQEIDVQSGIRLEHAVDEKKGRTLRVYNVDENFLDTYRLRLVEGRNLIKDSTRRSVILNYSAVKFLEIGSVSDAIGKNLIIGGKKAEIVGVVDDFSQKSLKHTIDPVIINYRPSSAQYYSIRLTNTSGTELADINNILSGIRNNFVDFYPNSPFDFFLLRDFFNAHYKGERNYRNILSVFSFLTFAIALLGLFGLSSYTISKRLKELAIRKVLGVDPPSIFVHFTKKPLLVVVIAQVLSIPVAYHFVRLWLTGFPYRIDLNFFHFLLPTLLVVVVALITLTFHIVKAIKVNPAKILSSN